MTVTAEDLARRVQALEDKNEIKELKSRYLRGCDRQLPELVRDCLDPDGCTIDFEGFPPFKDRDSFVNVYQEMGCRPGVIDMHNGQNPDIELTGPNTAKAKWDLYFYNIDLGARTMMQMSCEYDDEYVKKNGRWWIKKTASKRYSFFLQQVDEDGQPTIAALGDPDKSPISKKAD